MDIESFSRSPIGTLTRITGWDNELQQPYDHYAYVPEPLPRNVTLAQSTIKLMGEADRALGALNARIRFLPNPALLVQPALRMEAQATSALEGTYAHLDEILAADHIDPPKRSSEVREVMNYVEAAMQGIKLIEDLPICRRMLETIQKTLVSGTRGDGYDAGALRERQVFIGNKGQPVEEARFVPPPPGDILEAGFSEWERWVNQSDELPLLAKLAMTHYQFETLHPFSDGNGRLGRLIITLQLLVDGEIEYPILNLSAWFEPRRDQYIEALRTVSISGDFDPWVALFATAVRDRSRSALNTIDALLTYRDSVVEKAEQNGVRGVTSEVVDVIIGSPVLSIPDFRKARGVAYNTARALIEKLIQLGALVEITGASYNKVYFARQVARIISD
ncbi:MAG: Fic family protein [Microbacterium sp.]|nr:MAG: Fic family protein [Microbacterium sp.]